jgi:ferredoxin
LGELHISTYGITVVDAATVVVAGVGAGVVAVVAAVVATAVAVAADAVVDVAVAAVAFSVATAFADADVAVMFACVVGAVCAGCWCKLSTKHTFLMFLHSM